MLNELIKRIPESELRWIAERDYGTDADQHLEALKRLLHERQGASAPEYDWYPWEVI